MPVYLAPTYGAGWQGNQSGAPLNGGLLNTYLAGTTTPAATFTTSSGGVQNANPIQLGVDGRPPAEIWLTGGQAYKFVLTDSVGNSIKTDDNLSGIGDPNAPNVPSGYWILSGVGGTANAITAAAGVGCSLVTGNIYILPAGLTNTGAVTLAITPSGGAALTTKNVLKRTSGGLVALVANDLIASSEQILVYDGTQFEVIGSRPYSQGANIASAATINLDTATGDYVHVTGSTGPVTAITLAQGEERTVVFDSTPTLTNGASLVLRNGVTRATVAGEATAFRGEASGVVREIGAGTAKQPTRTVLTSGSGATYTTPAGATRINVRMVGGGAGGGGATANNGVIGGNTTFGTLTAGGGSPGVANSGAGGDGGTSSGGDINIAGGAGCGAFVNSDASVTVGGGNGGNSVFAGGGKSSQGISGGNAATNSGGGGGGAGAAAGVNTGGGGGAGGYVEKLIVSPSATFTYTVGAGGAGGAAGGAPGGNGAAGIIIVDEYYN